MQTRWNFEIYLCTLVLNNIKQQEDPRKLRAVSRKSRHKPSAIIDPPRGFTARFTSSLHDELPLHLRGKQS